MKTVGKEPCSPALPKLESQGEWCSAWQTQEKGPRNTLILGGRTSQTLKNWGYWALVEAQVAEGDA